MATNYPAGLDTFPTVSASTPMDTSGSEHDVLHNNLADAIVAVQTALGTNPEGSFTDLAERLDNIGAGSDVNIATTEPGSPEVGDFWLDIDSAPPAGSYADQGNAGSAKTVDINAADVQELTLNSSTCTLTFTGDPSAGFVRHWELHLTHDATTSSRAVTWPSDVEWPGGTDPTLLATTANAVALFRFTTRSDGIHFGEHVGNYLL